MPKNVMCKNCVNLLHDWCERVIDSPVPDMERDCQYFRQKTNADRIRAMSDEELRKLLIEFSAFACIFPDKDCEEVSCVECVTKWLQQPAEEG